ncbi:unnamed protein product [Heligmosomoides polygyrus]|uniref:WD repeat-containing protein 44 n=1 Tax=Heligmosomoides polygyrus TaxID=6339 RepID=A0A3P8B625_HELPZ|nr:unnamed protein product [Heligmosomoides polygyrus]
MCYMQSPAPAYLNTTAVRIGEPSSSASRRDRLTALRRRMREEFGARDLGLTYGATPDCDTLSVASEATSLHSWHRRVLASSQTMVLRLNVLTMKSFQVSSELRSPPPLPPRNPSIRLPDPVATELVARLNLPVEADRKCVDNKYYSNGSGEELNDTSGSVETALNSSIDPITRDVERRMSMKRDGPLSSEGLSDEIRSERFPNSRSSFDHAKTWARSYGSYASGLFRGAFQKMKSAAHGSASVKVDDTSDSEGEQSESGIPSTGHNGPVVRPRKGKKGPFDFEQLRVVQELNNEHTGAVWCVRFSVCGRLMATAGQDNIIRVWAARSHLKYFIQMRERLVVVKLFLRSHRNVAAINDMESFRPPSSTGSNAHSKILAIHFVKPCAQTLLSDLFGHTADILDLSWSKNYFVLSSGMDRTVKLWHLSRNECLCCFQHVDFVTSVAFLPKDDRYFLSGSLDGKLRMWHIPDKKVAVWNEVKFITAITFVKNGKFAVVGTYNGRCFFYSTDQLKYHTVVDVRSSRGKNARGHKVTGLAVHGDKLLVTSNDSRIRMYDVRDKALTCKFRGAQNEHSQIRAAFSPDGRHIVCGSEDKFIYLWRTSDLPSTLSVRKDRNAMWERVRAHSAPVSVAVFAPKPQVRFDCCFSCLRVFTIQKEGRISPQTSQHVVNGHVIVSADLQGCIKIMVNRPKLNKAGASSSSSVQD